MATTASAYVDATAIVEDDATIGVGTKIWGLAQVRSDATLGRWCVVGRGAFIDAGVRVGDNCKIQNNSLVYAPARLDDGVFIGPAAVLTNDRHPRAVNPDGSLKSAAEWEAVGVVVKAGASVGAAAVCIAPVTIGAWATIAAGSVVTTDVPNHALVAGIPAKLIGWVGRAGKQLVPDGHGQQFRCPETGERYVLRGEGLERLVEAGPR